MICLPGYKGQNTLGDKLQQHVAVTNYSLCTGRATSCSNKMGRHIAVTNHFVCTTEFLVAARICQKLNRTEFVHLVVVTKFCCREEVFHKNSPVHTRRFVAATCHHDMWLQFVA